MWTSVKARRVWLQIHLWLGLCAGALLVLIGLSGSVLVFYREIDAWLNPQHYAAASGARQPLQRLVAAAHRHLPHSGRPTLVQVPAAPGWPAVVDIAEAGASGERHHQVYVDPAAARILGARLWQESFVGIVYSLLLRQYGGMEVVGILGIALLISLATGL
jgi:uncharacterized iron-regulated membrane protein